MTRDENTRKNESSSVSVKFEESSLSEAEKDKFKDFLIEFGEVFSDKPGLTPVTPLPRHEINTGSVEINTGH